MDVFLHGVDWILGGACVPRPQLHDVWGLPCSDCRRARRAPWALTESSGLDCPGLPGSQEAGAVLPEGLSPGNSPSSSTVHAVRGPPGGSPGTDPTSHWDKCLRFGCYFQSTTVLFPFYRRGNQGSRSQMISVL